MKKPHPINRLTGVLDNICLTWREELRRVLHDEGAVIFVIIVPLLYPLLYSWIYTNEVTREVPIAVVDLSHSQKSRQFIRDMDASPNVRVAYHCADMAEAERLVARQEAKGILYFPPDFSRRINRDEQTHAGLYCDMSLMLTYKAIYMAALEVATDINTRLQVARAGAFTEQDEELATHPLRTDEVALYNATEGYGNSLIPAVLILIIQQTLMLGIGLLAGTERERNGGRPPVSPGGRHGGVLTAITGKTLCYLMLYAVLGLYLLLVVPRLFGYTSLLSLSTACAFLLPYILACVFFCMSLSCLVRYRESVFLLVVFTSVPFLFLSGVSWPRESIPPFWQSIGCLFPSTFGIRGFLRLNGMGASLSDIRVEYLALWGQVLVYFLLAYFQFRRQLHLARKSPGSQQTQQA